MKAYEKIIIAAICGASGWLLGSLLHSLVDAPSLPPGYTLWKYSDRYTFSPSNDEIVVPLDGFYRSEKEAIKRAIKFEQGYNSGFVNFPWHPIKGKRIDELEREREAKEFEQKLVPILDRQFQQKWLPQLRQRPEPPWPNIGQFSGTTNLYYHGTNR